MFEEIKAQLLASVRAGSSIEDAASKAGVSVNTCRCWLRKGRRDPQGRYGRFASEIDALRGLQELPRHMELGAMTRDELEGLLAQKVRAGSVPAMALWARLHAAEFATPAEGVGSDPFAEFEAR